MHKLFSSEENGREHDGRVLTWKLVFHVRVACQQSPCVPAFKYRQGNGSRQLYSSRAASSQAQIPARSHFPIKKRGKEKNLLPIQFLHSTAIDTISFPL